MIRTFLTGSALALMMSSLVFAQTVTPDPAPRPDPVDPARTPDTPEPIRSPRDARDTYDPERVQRALKELEAKAEARRQAATTQPADTQVLEARIARLEQDVATLRQIVFRLQAQSGDTGMGAQPAGERLPRPAMPNRNVGAPDRSQPMPPGDTGDRTMPQPRRNVTPDPSRRPPSATPDARDPGDFAQPPLRGTPNAPAPERDDPGQ